MTIAQHLKLLVILSLLLLVAIVISAIKAAQNQNTAYEQLHKIMSLEIKVDALRSNLWLLQHYNDRLSYQTADTLQKELAEMLNTISTNEQQQKRRLQHLMQMNQDISHIISLSFQHLENNEGQGMNSTAIMLQARLNMIIQSIGHEIYAYQTTAMRNTAKQQEELRYLIGTLLLLIVVILIVFTTRALNRFKASLHTLHQGMVDLIDGDLESQIPPLYRDEFQFLFDRFNNMKSMLNISTKKTVQLQAEIEAQNERLKAQQTKLQQIADHDDLTGLFSRYAFKQHVNQAIILCHRNQHKAAIIFIDINKFKPINDTLGHAAGDQVLITVAKRIIATIRHSDIACRLGGDEFLVWLNPIDKVEDVETIIEKLHSALDSPIAIDDNIVNISASIGYAHYPQQGSTLDKLIQIADKEMYDYKNTIKHPLTASQNKS